MKKTAVLPSIIIASLALTVSAQPQTVARSPLRFPQHQPHRLTGQGLTPRFQTPHPAVSPDVIWVQCPPEAQALGAMTAAPSALRS